MGRQLSRANFSRGMEASRAMPRDSEPLRDHLGRPTDSLRISISITDRRNYRSLYCMPEGGLEWLDRKGIVTTNEEIEEIGRVIRAAVRDKEPGHRIGKSDFTPASRSMWQIGGYRP